MVPVFLDFLREAGGAKMPQRWRDHVVMTRRAFRMTSEERSQARPGIPVWWPLPAEHLGPGDVGFAQADACPHG
jgi:hypothetical protein